MERLKGKPTSATFSSDGRFDESWGGNEELSRPKLRQGALYGTSVPTDRRVHRRLGFSATAALPAFVTFQLIMWGSAGFSGSISFLRCRLRRAA
jgi:hypothetical protein